MIVLFDVDGTLAISGKQMEKEMADIILKFRNKFNCSIAIVGGGNIKKIIWQINDYGYLFDYIFSECGAIIHKKNVNNDNFRCIYRREMMDYIDDNTKEELDDIIELFIKEIKKHNIITKGNNIDVRSGLIYLSIPGMEANDDIRELFFQYEKKTNFIDKTLKLLQEKTNSLVISKGGSAGYSLSLQGWDKSQVMDILPNIININNRNILFFGDKCESDGNDYPLYSHKLIKGYSVKNYQDTIKKLSMIINNN